MTLKLQNIRLHPLIEYLNFFVTFFTSHIIAINIIWVDSSELLNSVVFQYSLDLKNCLVSRQILLNRHLPLGSS